MMHYLRNQKGYTLTELMVVVAIVGVLAALAVPNYLSYLPHLRLNAAARDLISYARSARNQAAITGKTPGIELQVTLNTYPTPDSFTILNGASQIASPVTLPGGVDIDRITSSGGIVGLQTYTNGISSSWASGGRSDSLVFTPLGSSIHTSDGSGNIVSIFLCSVVSGSGCSNGGGEMVRIDISPTTGFTRSCSGWSVACP